MSDRWPDKVAGLVWATRWHERAIRDARFANATRHRTAFAHLMDDLRGERR